MYLASITLMEQVLLMLSRDFIGMTYYTMRLDKMKLAGKPVVRFASFNAKFNSKIADTNGITIRSSSES